MCVCVWWAWNRGKLTVWEKQKRYVKTPDDFLFLVGSPLPSDECRWFLWWFGLHAANIPVTRRLIFRWCWTRFLDTGSFYYSRLFRTQIQSLKNGNQRTCYNCTWRLIIQYRVFAVPSKRLLSNQDTCSWNWYIIQTIIRYAREN